MPNLSSELPIMIRSMNSGPRLSPSRRLVPGSGQSAPSIATHVTSIRPLSTAVRS
jgi:hypothetical protein